MIGTVVSILHGHLLLNKICARWVPKCLTKETKQVRVDISKSLLSRYHQGPSILYRKNVTADETWLHHYDPESKQESMEWHHADSPPPRKFRRARSAKKIMAVIFWDSEGILLIDCVPRGQTVTGTYYSSMLPKLRQNIKDKRRGMLRAGVILHHDNAAVHTCKLTTAEIRQCGFETLPHPPYSPDLAPTDFHLFPRLK